MNLGRLMARAGRLQEQRGFKIAASVVVGLLVVGGFVTYWVLVAAGRVDLGTARLDEEFLNTAAGRALGGVLQTDGGLTAAAVASALALAVWGAVIWLGLGLTYLALNVVGVAVAAALLPFDASGGLSRLVIGGVLLAQGFAVGLQGLRAVLSAHSPITAVARNVINEAVRMKISLVFIVLLVIALATLPAALDPERALRYRVQTFLSWGTGLSFWTLALLTLLFGCATVTFEQRDKIIWQTMTKPVAAWQYVLGKWLGLASLNLVLLAVCSGGVFLFVEYLRSTPALGESEAYVAASGAAVTEDRLLLQTEVLTARTSSLIDYPPAFTPGTEPFEEGLAAAMEAAERTAGGLDTAAERGEFIENFTKNLQESYRSIPPGGFRDYRISGLDRALSDDLPLTFRFKADSGGNRPDVFYNISIAFTSTPVPTTPEVREVPLGIFYNIPISPEVIVPEEGAVYFRVYNGELFETPNGGAGIAPNERSIRFPGDGLQISYAVGSYHLNYFRAFVVLWIKLALIAMIAVCAGTFLSFPVACLVSITVFLLAEMSGWLADAGDIYGYRGFENELLWYKVISTPVAEAVGTLFAVYHNLNPIDRIVEGRYLPWSALGAGLATLAAMTAALYGIGVMVFSRRELATYSGQ